MGSPQLRLFAAVAVLAGLWSAVPSAPARAQSCINIGSTIVCGTRGSNNRVGRVVIFNQGRPGAIVGDGLEVDENGRRRLDRVLPKQPRASGATPPGRPPGSFVDLHRGKDFGATGLRSGPSFGGLRPSTGRLTPSGPNP